MSGQAHVVLEMVEIVTDQLGDDPVLLRHFLLHLNHLCPGRAELLLQGVEQAVVYSTLPQEYSTLTFGERVLLVVVEWKREVK